MSLNRAHIQYVLNQFDAGASPHRILDCLQNSAFLPGLTLATVEQCLCENGRITYSRSGHHETQAYQSPSLLGHAASNLLPAPANHQAAACISSSSTTLPVPPASNQTGASSIFPPTTLQEVYQQAPHANSAVQTFATDVVVADDPEPTASWDTLADKFVLMAYQMGYSLPDIWATLRRSGYNVTQTQVRESLANQRFAMFR